MSQPLISINIITFNNEKTILPTLESANRQTYPASKILIIDNASNDQTVKLIKTKLPLWRQERTILLKEKFPNESWSADIQLIENNKNIGFAAGHNQAIRQNYGEFILCLNPDLILAPDFIEKAIAVFADKKIAAVQGKLLQFDFAKNEIKKDPRGGQPLIDTTGLLIFRNRRVINRGQGETDQNQYSQTEEIFGADGAAPLYRRQALEDTRLKISKNGQKITEYFDEDFFCYKEDVDLAWRLRLFGWQTVYQPQAIGWHGRTAGEKAAFSPIAIAKERQKISAFAKYYSFKNQRLMQIKNEMPELFLRDLPRIIIKEIASWLYFFIFEKKRLTLIKELLNQIPAAFQKRKLIMRGKRTNPEKISRWLI